MSGDPACVEAHHGNALDESLVVSSKGGLANAFVYVKSGLEGKTFATPSTPFAIDQTVFTPWSRSNRSGTIVRERENRRLPEISPGRRS